MPPIIRFDRNAVLAAALELTRKDGLQALNARAVAREMGSSTQPIFRLFSGMDELKADVIELIKKEYLTFIQSYASSYDSLFLSTTLGYVLFARQEPEFFKILFMSDCTLASCPDMLIFPDEYIDQLQQQMGFSRDNTVLGMQWVWTFAHGLAVGFATKYCDRPEDNIKVILAGALETVHQQMDRLIS